MGRPQACWKANPGSAIITIDRDMSFIINVYEGIYVPYKGRVIAEGHPTLLRENPDVAGRSSRAESRSPTISDR
jgi:ABC-type branched-subunit amino acid transport system ATPase component